MEAEFGRGTELQELLRRGSFSCSCGERHSPGVEKVLIGRGACWQLPELLRECGAKKPFLLSGHDSFEAAGARVSEVLDAAGIATGVYVYPVSPVKPTETALGSAVMHFDWSCDAIVGIGSGVINDIGKLLAKAVGLPYFLVATAPSMDGFVSATSSMERDGLKVSLPSRAARAVIGDLDILCRAPEKLLLAGVGDMLAKIISLREWKLAEIIVDEPYCPVIAEMVEQALTRVLAEAEGLLLRKEESVRAVTEGLVVAGLAMNYAGLSRPASGMEHYLSHIWDMRALAFPEARVELHGIQTGIGTLICLRAYEALLRADIRPDAERAFRRMQRFSLPDWNRQLREFIGPGAEAMILLEEKEQKYSPEKHRLRFATIAANWDRITEEIRKLPSSEEIETRMRAIAFPTDASVIGYDAEQIRTSLMMTGDIRDKYIGSRLFRDLGVLEEIAAEL